jgi:ubiquinone/menaquinone biosynthesis C-methylase UbiE
LGQVQQIKLPAGIDWRYWIERWDRMQDSYLPRRKERFELMVGLISGTQQSVASVLDIGCGTGSLMLPLLEEFREAEVFGIDFDPTLLALAEKRLAEYVGRIHLVQADLRGESWMKLVPDSMDAAVSATALHWFNPEQLEGFYKQLARVMRSGGIFLNADHVRSDSESIQKAWQQHREQMIEQEGYSGAEQWESFWDAYGQALKIDIEDFRRNLTGPWEGSEEGLTLDWHFEKLKASGFRAVDCFWRCGCDAIYGGIRQSA